MTRFTSKTNDEEGGLVKTFISYVLPIALLFLFCCVETVLCMSFALGDSFWEVFLEFSFKHTVFSAVVAAIFCLPFCILYFATKRLSWGWRLCLFAVINGVMIFSHYVWFRTVAEL